MNKPLGQIKLGYRVRGLGWSTGPERQIDHFTVVSLVTWPLNGSEAGDDLVLIQTSLFLLCKSSCSYAN